MPPALTAEEIKSLEAPAQRHWSTFTRAGIRFAAELRRLQDGQAHLQRGFRNFGTYAEATFPGLTAANAKQICRQGGVLLTLEEEGRIDLQAKKLPGTTALRVLSGAQGALGREAMVTIYDRAVTLRGDPRITGHTVSSAMHDLGVVPEPRAAKALLEVEEVEEEPDEEAEALPEEVHDLLDHVRVLERHVSDLMLNASDPTLPKREWRNVEEEMEVVRALMLAAHGQG